MKSLPRLVRAAWARCIEECSVAGATQVSVMVRALLVGAALLVAVGAILVQLRARGVPVRAALKLAGFGAGFVVSVKMMLGGYLALQGEAEPPMVEVVGLYGSIGLALFFGWVTLALWRRLQAEHDFASQAARPTRTQGDGRRRGAAMTRSEAPGRTMPRGQV